MNGGGDNGDSPGRMLVRHMADGHMLDLMRIAAKAADLDHILLVLGEIEALERDLQNLTKSKSRTVDLKRLEIMGRLHQAKDMLKRFRQRHA